MSFANSVILYNCKINHNGLFGCDFGGSGATRDSVMGASSNIATIKFTYGSCTYMRKDKTITVDCNADVLDAAGVNYCRYINADFSSSMYFYAFVRKIEYVAPQTSRLYIETDCFMTYFDKINWGWQYVERLNRGVPYNTHSSTGGLYMTDFLSDNGYTAPRCLDSSAFPIDFDLEAYDGTNNNGWIIISLKKDPFITDNEPNMSSISHVLSGLPEGGVHWIAVEPTDYWLFTSIISGPMDWGSVPERARFTIADVIAVYYIPRNCIYVDQSQGSPDYREVVEERAGAPCPYWRFTIPSSWQGGTLYRQTIVRGGLDMANGYTPKNPALLRYPYNYFKITDRAGHEWIFKPEMFRNAISPDLEIQYTKYFSIGDTVSMGVKIENYMDDDCKECICIFQDFPQLSASSDYYQQYLAMHRNSLQNQYRWMGYDMALGVGSAGIKAAGGFMTDNPAGVVSGAEGLFSSAINYERQNDALQARLADMKSYPASIVCSGDGNLQMIMDSSGLFLEKWSIDTAAAHNIDKTYDALGYPVNIVTDDVVYRLKEKYSYTKTKNCHITGVIPESDRSKIDKLFDAGMTVWHNAADYGTYDLAGNNPSS